MIFVYLFFVLLFGNYCDASSSFTPNLEKISGKALPNVHFTAADGSTVRLSDFKDKTLILHPMFTHCPSTCTFISSQLSTAIHGLSQNERRNLQVVSFSFDPKETSESIEKFEKMFRIDRSLWKVVRADAVVVQQLLTALDYRTLQLSTSNYQHPNLLFVVGKDGILQDYIYGSDLTSERLDEALRSTQGSSPRLLTAGSYIYVFAVIGVLISTFLVVEYFAKGHRH
jgi:protein SCO1